MTSRGKLVAFVAAAVFVALAVVAGCVIRDGSGASKPEIVLPPATTQADPVLGPDTDAGRKLRASIGGERPNIVVVMMDDMRYDELRFAPNVVELAKKGTSFVNSFSPYPLCCPARASFLTGQLAHNHGVLFHGNDFGFASLKDAQTVATRLQGAGYLTGFSGKYLNGYGRQKLRSSGKPSARYVPPGWTDWRASVDEGWGGAGGTYNYFGLTQNINGQIKHNKGTYSSAVIARDGAEMVQRFSDADAPFMLYLNPVAPHYGGPREPDDPRPIVTKGLRVKYATPARPDWVKGRLDAQIPYALGVRADGGPSEPYMDSKPPHMAWWLEPTQAEKDAMREVERQRAESIYAWDAEFKKVLDALRETGELDRTVLVFTSDNGYYNGEQRRRSGKIQAHDVVLRVPLVIAGPGTPAGLRYAPATTSDLTATILDLARAGGLPRPDGRSLLSLVLGPDQPWTTPVLTEGRLPNMRRNIPFPEGLQTGGVRVPGYQLIMYSSGAGELYDMDADPNQLKNLYGDPGHRAVRDRLLQLWRRYQTCAVDQCHVPLPEDLRAGSGELERLEERRQQARVEFYR